MKLETVKKISNKYGIIKQIFENKVQIRTNNLIYSAKYNAYMFIISNNSCIWLKPWQVKQTVVGRRENMEYQINGLNTYLVEITPENFKYIKNYEESFENYYFSEEDEINSYEQLKEIAQLQENEQLVTRVI